MDPATIALLVQLIQYSIQGITAITNGLGVQDEVSKILARHVAAGTSAWTDADKQEITDLLASSKAYAAAQITAAGGTVDPAS